MVNAKDAIINGRIYRPLADDSTNNVSNGNKDDAESILRPLPVDILASLDAILVLGGGVPPTPHDPPTYVKERCRIASVIFRHVSQMRHTPPQILTLSAGTAHLPQLISKHLRLPVWESTASASYLIHRLGIPPQHVFAETTSFDTVSNAFFARTSFADVVGWRNLLVITSEFHIERTKAIFDWILHAPRSFADDRPYRLHYYASSDVGLTSDALSARHQKEKQSRSNVLRRLGPEHPKLEDVWDFLVRDHALYNASMLSDRSDEGEGGAIGKPVKDSYGGLPMDREEGIGSDSFVGGVLVGLLVAWILGWVRTRVVGVNRTISPYSSPIKKHRI